MPFFLSLRRPSLLLIFFFFTLQAIAKEKVRRPLTMRLGILTVLAVEKFDKGIKERLEYEIREASEDGEALSEGKTFKIVSGNRNLKFLTGDLVLVSGYEYEDSIDITVPHAKIKRLNNREQLSHSQRLYGAPDLYSAPLAEIIVDMQNGALKVPLSVQTVEAAVFGTVVDRSVDTFYQEASYGRMGVKGKVFRITISDIPKSCDFRTWGNKAILAGADQGIDFAAYPRRQFIFPLETEKFCGVGWGELGGYNSWITGYNPILIDVFTHELGHNFGFDHAGAGSDEYGDVSCPMGYSGVGHRHFNAPHKIGIGWVEPAKIRAITAPGTYRIGALETNSPDTLALRLAIPGTDTSYYFSYRVQNLYDSSLSSDYVNKTNIHVAADPGIGMTTFQQVLVDGQSFQTENGTTFKQISHSNTEAVVEVSMACNASLAPRISISPDEVTVKSEGAGTFKLQINNPNNSHCPKSDYQVSASLTPAPEGWLLDVNSEQTSTASVQLAAGASMSIPVKVISTPNSLSEEVNLGISVADAANDNLAASITAKFQVTNTPPTVPSYFRANKKSRTQVILRWRPASDDIGVAGYEIYRGEQLIAKTAARMYIDNFRVSGTTRYKIRAFDEAGNYSAFTASKKPSFQ